MALSQHLVQKQTQRLVITQELRQSIELLPLSNLELNEKIQQELMENPLLEDITPPPEIIDYNPKKKDTAQSDSDSDSFFSNTVRDAAEKSDGKHQFFQNTLSSPETLKDSLMSQMNLLEMTEEEYEAGEVIISDLNEKGFLRTSLQDLSEGMKISLKALENALQQIQQLDPIGCGAKNIQESLYIQAKTLNPEDKITLELLLNHFEKLEKLDYKGIEKKTGFTHEEIQKSLQFIKKLEPYPGTLFESQKIQYIIPDIIVRETNHQIEIFINDEWIPSLKINDEYMKIMENTGTSGSDKNYFHSKLDSANWLIKSIQQRRKTLHVVMDAIVKVQKNFFLQGPGYLVPMTLRDIADSDDVNLHESTVSRITTNKYVQTKWGIFELKYFFTGSLNSSEGDEKHSAKNIQEKIKKIVEDEALEHILSDQEIADRIGAEGISIARRTVAKYRKTMHILPVERRRKIKEINKGVLKNKL